MCFDQCVPLDTHCWKMIFGKKYFRGMRVQRKKTSTFNASRWSLISLHLRPSGLLTIWSHFVVTGSCHTFSESGHTGEKKFVCRILSFGPTPKTTCQVGRLASSVTIVLGFGLFLYKGLKPKWAVGYFYAILSEDAPCGPGPKWKDMIWA